MYSKRQIRKAIRLYQKCGSITETVRKLGYPSRNTLYHWINSENPFLDPRDGADRPIPRKHTFTEQEKENAVLRCFKKGESVKLVSTELGCSATILYKWRDRYYERGTIPVMVKRKNRNAVKDSAETTEIEELKEQLRDLQMEVDILKGILDVLKKDRGTDWRTLKNSEKAELIGALKNDYTLPELLEKLEIAKSSYFYQVNARKKPDKYSELRAQIRDLFEKNKRRYGYRRIHSALRKAGTIISEKVVRRIMREEGLRVKIKKRRKYNSYRGEITPAVPNLVKRNFHSDKPEKLLLTDISEFALPAGKVYLSPMLDCFDGYLITWKIGLHPNADLVNSMLDETIERLKSDAKPIIHTDRGSHYRWPGWIERMKDNNFTRSMSKKGCSPDNAACEGLFGRIKNEFFYCQDWMGVSLNEFMKELDEYLHWYNEERIKESLGFMSPEEYRGFLGIAT